MLVEVSSSDGALNYLYAGRLYSRIGTDEQIYYHQDGLGSILAITDENGIVENTYTYDVFGDLRTKNETISNSILFTGELVDEAGNVYLRARLYDPTIGRFLTKDTFEGDINYPLSLNLYTYCENNPVIYVDPSGNYLETAIDIAFLAYDISELANDPTNLVNWTAFIADGLCTALPVATGGGALIRSASHVNDLVTVGTRLDKAEKIEAFGYGKAVMRYKSLKKIMAGTGLEVHHLIEKRFADKLGLNENDILSVDF